MTAYIQTESKRMPAMIENAITDWIGNEDTEEYLILHQIDNQIEIAEIDTLRYANEEHIDYSIRTEIESATATLVKKDANPLEQHVVNWINEQAADSYTEANEEAIKSVISNLQRGGCQSGMVPHLIYYNQTTEFFDNYEAEITEVINNFKDGTGDNSIIAGNVDKFGNVDDFDMTQLKNRMAWAAFEIVADQIANEAGIE